MTKKNWKGWPAFGLAIVASLALAACGGSDSSDGNASVRVLNATLTHPSIDLLVGGSATVSSTVAADALGAYVSPASGSTVLQINDTGGSTALTKLTPTIGSGAHDTLVVYEGASGAIRTTLLPEDATAPATGASAMRVLNTATDAGAIDVYVTPSTAAVPSVDLATVSPTFSVAAQNFVQLADALTLTPGTYQVRVTGQGNKTDLRADLRNVVLASAQLGLLVLTPTSGGVLLNAGVLLQQVATTYTAQRNTSARVRLVSGLPTGSATLSASAGASVIAPASTPTPAVTAYTTVPAVGSATSGALAVTVNGVARPVPVATLPAGSDNTLLVTGTAAAPTVAVLADDNHLPATATSVKIRLVNGTSGTTATPLALAFNANFLPPVAPGFASAAYSTLALPANAATTITVNTAAGTQLDTKSSLALTANAVYTFFVLGDATPVPTLSQLRQDR